MIPTPKKVLNSMPSDEKGLLDLASVWALFGVFAEMLPVFVLFLTAVWTCIRIYETETVQRIFNRGKDTPPDTD